MGVTQFSAIHDDRGAKTTLTKRASVFDHTINMLSTRRSLCLSTAAFLLYVGIGIVRSRYASFMLLASSAYEYIRPSGDTNLNRRRTRIDVLDDDSRLKISTTADPVFWRKVAVILGISTTNS